LSVADWEDTQLKPVKENILKIAAKPA